MKQIYLIRHAETVMNQQNRFSGIYDCELSEKGYSQIEKLGKDMKKYDIQCCYSSPLKRAYQTAKSFWEEPVIVDSLHEMDFGDIDGRLFEELKDEYGEEFKYMISDRYNYNFPNGEKRYDMMKRANDTYEEIIKNDNNDSIAIVAHSCILRAIIAKQVVGDYSFSWKIQLGNCSISKLLKYKNSTRIEFLNRQIEI